MKWVIDACVAAKWIAPEAESARAVALLDDELSVPDLFYPEVANVLWKKQARGEMHAAAAEAAARWLLQVPLQVHESWPLMAEALALSSRLNHPARDCVYLALARLAGCPLVTADRRLFDRLQRSDAAQLGAIVVLLANLDAPAGH